MKILWVLSAVITINCIVIAHAGECDKFTPLGGKMSGPCCKLPEPKDAPLIKKLFDELKAKESNISIAPALAECKMIEQFLTEKKLLKDKELDKEASLKYLETAVDDAKWKEILKTTFEMCYKEVSEKIAEIQEKFEKLPAAQGGIKKDQCNIKLMAINTCMVLEAIFKKCPDESMNKEKECNSMREWVGKCRNTIQSFGELALRVSP